VHADDASRLVAIGAQADRITVTGDVRYDQVWERVHAPASANSAIVTRLGGDRPSVVAGSTWPGDDACLLDAWPDVRRSAPRARLIVAPHEPDEDGLHSIEERAGQLGLSTARLDAATPDTDLVVVDRMGVLADLYALAAGNGAAFVGGGFHDAGLHSVVEPAAHGVPVLFGPRHTDSRDAKDLIAAGGAFGVSNATDLAARFAQLLANPETRTRAGEGARRVIQSGLGAADKSAALILPLLRPLRLSR
jgi:3-deoxy-D-manno-octulosonic-acid transferase